MTVAPGGLANRVAFVTGACGGIGRAIVEGFLTAGAAVVIADLDERAATASADKANDAGHRALGLRLDVTSENSVESAVDKTVSKWGRLDILVSNAGVQHVSAVDELAFDDWRRVLAVHLDGGFLVTRACLRQMYRQNHGRIIYMGSVHSLEASVLKAPYVAAKHGLLGLCRVVAKEGAAHNVAASVVCPGFVKTELVERQIPEQAQRLGISQEEVIRNVMLRQTVDASFTTVSEVTDAVLFLAAFPTLALTGQSIVVSHGWHMK